MVLLTDELVCTLRRVMLRHLMRIWKFVTIVYDPGNILNPDAAGLRRLAIQMARYRNDARESMFRAHQVLQICDVERMQTCSSAPFNV